MHNPRDARLNRYSEAQVLDMAKLIEKRKAQGLGPTLIASRLGISYRVMLDLLQRSEVIMAKAGEGMATKTSRTLPMLLAKLREDIKRIKAGMYTHDTQDIQTDLATGLDAMEAELKALGIQVKEDKPKEEQT